MRVYQKIPSTVNIAWRIEIENYFRKGEGDALPLTTNQRAIVQICQMESVRSGRPIETTHLGFGTYQVSEA